MIGWFTVPLLLGNLFQQLYAVTDALVVGRLLGVDALAAVGASGSLQFLLFGFGFGSASGIAIPVARAFGAGNLPAMRRAVTAGVVVSAGITVAVTVIGTVGSRPLLTLLGTPPELMGMSATFLAVLFSGTITTIAFGFLSAIIRALGDSRTPLIFLIVSCVLNAGLVVLLIAGLGMGVGGAALATIIAQALSVMLCLVLVWRRMPDLHLHREDWRFSRAELSDAARLGLSMGFQISIVAIGAAILQYGVNQLGTDVIAAFTASIRVEQVGVTPLVSLGVALSTYVAQNYGAGQYTRIRVGVFRASLLSIGFALALGLVIQLWGTQLVRLFVGSGSDDVVAMSHRFLVITSSTYATVALLLVFRNALQGLGMAAVPTIAGAMELLARAVVGLYLIHRWGFFGVIIAGPLAWVAALTPLVVAWIIRHRRLRALDSAEVLGPVGEVALAPT